MDEHTAQIEHLVQHYLHRDLFRIYARDYLQRSRSGSLYDTWNLAVSHYKHNGDTPDDWVIATSVVHKTREALKRARPATLRHLHDKLHTEPMLAVHEHVHNDGVIFTYVIHEVEF